MPLTALVPAGGLGTRLLPLTRAVPKALLPVGAVPAIEHALAELQLAGIERAVVLTSSPVSEPVRRHLAPGGTAEAGRPPPRWAGLRVDVVDIPWVPGLGEVFAYARGLVGAQPFVLALPDEILPGEPRLLRALLRAGDRFTASAAAVLDGAAGPLPGVFRFGAVRQPEGGAAGGPAAGPTMIGRFVLRPDVFAVLDALRGTGGSGGHALPDIIGRLAATSTVVGVRCTTPYWDIGTLPGYLRAAAAFSVAEPGLPRG
jgi:UTP--glucose-1-phosphate uridylyltransferase